MTQFQRDLKLPRRLASQLKRWCTLMVQHGFDLLLFYLLYVRGVLQVLLCYWALFYSLPVLRSTSAPGPKLEKVPVSYRCMIYDGKVSFVLSMQNRCILFVALYFLDLAVLSFPLFSIKLPFCPWKAASHWGGSYFCPRLSGRTFGCHKQEASFIFKLRIIL